jgi:hypothetical protein
MGLLLDSAFWAHVTGEMWRIRSIPHTVMSRESTVTFLGVACKALDDLLRDPTFDTDMYRTASIFDQQGPKVSLHDAVELGQFLDEFSRAETTLLLASGINFACAVDIVEELRRVAHFTKQTSPDAVFQLRERLGPLRDITCNAAKAEAADIASGTKSRSIWQAIKGWAAVGIDGAGAAVAQFIEPIFVGPIAMGSVVATSIGLGSTAVAQATDTLSHMR